MARTSFRAHIFPRAPWAAQHGEAWCAVCPLRSQFFACVKSCSYVVDGCLLVGQFSLPGVDWSPVGCSFSLIELCVTATQPSRCARVKMKEERMCSVLSCHMCFADEGNFEHAAVLCDATDRELFVCLFDTQHSSSRARPFRTERALQVILSNSNTVKNQNHASLFPPWEWSSQSCHAQSELKNDKFFLCLQRIKRSTPCHSRHRNDVDRPSLRAL